MKKIKLIFFGTPKIAVPVLEALFLSKDFFVSSVITKPDTLSPRTKKPTSSPVKYFALEHSIPCFTPEKFNNNETLSFLSDTKADLAVVFAYGKILPSSVISLFSRGVVNVHPSLLPELRGPSPLSFAILKNFSQTGVSFMLLDEGMDSGPLLDQIPFPLDSRETLSSLTEKAAVVAAHAIVSVLKKYIAGDITPLPQDSSRASFCPLLRRSDGKIDWSQDASQIERMIRAFTPWPGAFTDYRGIHLKIIAAHVGKDGACVFPCGQNTFLSADMVQPAGKKIMSGADFLRGILR